MKSKMTHARLRELLRYEPETGLFTWVISTGRRARAGNVAGCLDGEGYRVVKLDRIRYMQHRLVWLYVHGAWPKQYIDHINGQKADNRIENLRDVDNRTNQENRHRAMRSTWHGFLGVCCPGKGRPSWTAAIRVAGETVPLGKFATPEAAHEAYLVAKRRLHAGCTI